MSYTLALTLALTTWSQPTADEVLRGQATYYRDSLMARVADNRGLLRGLEYEDWLAAEGLVGAVALNRKGDLHRRVWLDGPLGVEGPFYVLDCARREHYLDRETAGYVVEVDFATADRWGIVGVGPVAVEVWFQDPYPIGKVLHEPL